MTFGTRLREAMDTRGPCCVGIDPHPALLDAWGLTDSPFGLERFCQTVVEALGGTVAVTKPQSALFERHGSRGIAVLERVVSELRGMGSLVVLDVKRGDIGSTAQAYADAYLDPNSPLAVDAITASPFLGLGSLDPIVSTALANDAGVFVLALTSNPEGAQVQRAITQDGRSVAGAILDAIASLNVDAAGLGSIGAVVGATIADVDENLDVNGPLLVPGIGAQGGTVAEVRRLFGPVIRNVLPSSSRQILAAGPDRSALRTAAQQLTDQFAALRDPGPEGALRAERFGD
ncbi:MAG TPA: orotidine-5'-phosphate decarboxylase [Nocardioidaceae bacterium]|nr:orotidine-5'-phosphate decarboxylase [Nocardioidaceae bacterium]